MTSNDEVRISDEDALGLVCLLHPAAMRRRSRCWTLRSASHGAARGTLEADLDARRLHQVIGNLLNNAL
jgi:signal transduction histidine kinase